MDLNFGKLSDQIYALDKKISEANAKVDALKGQRKELEQQLLQAMTSVGTDAVRGKSSQATISTVIRAQIKDFDALTAFIKRKSAFHLFERRIASKAYSEMKASLGGKPVPGLEDFVQTKVNVRKAN